MQRYNPMDGTTSRFEATLSGDVIVDDETLIPMLIIPVEIENKSNTEARIISSRMNITVVTSQDNKKIYTYLGSAYEKQPKYTTMGANSYISISPKSSHILYFAMPIYHEILIRLEKLRSGGDVIFICEIFVWSMIHNGSVYEPVFDKSIVKDRGRNEIVISKSDWIKNILNRTPYTKLSVVELPEPKTPTDEILHKVVEYLHNAWKKYMMGDYYGAVTDIRRALDSLRNEYFKKVGILTEDQINWGRLTQSQTEKKVLKNMFDALLKLGSKAAHEGANSITRENAELAIITSQAFIKFVLDLIRYSTTE